MTKDQEVQTGFIVGTDEWRSEAKYSLIDSSGTVLSSGTAAVSNSDLDDDAAHQDLMAKIADAITSANFVAATAGGAPAAASPASGGAQSYAAGQLADAVGTQNYRDLVAKAYRSLVTKPPVPADALADKTAGDAALARGDAAAASTAYLAAANSAIWWPEAHRALALALAKTNQLASAIIEGRMYLQLVPNAPDAQSMNELVAEWSKAAPPPILPSNIAMPPGLPGWGIQVADTPDVVTSAMGRPNAKGVLVLLVLTGSPAQTAGFEVGDVIVSVNGDAITSPENLRAITSTLPPHT
ncbi:MAG: PDZ domain-containing protein, partial [Betaproteobacteria bacterium]|nr:PDZ domain-containing protein [Betaproteobacteria bacterium]